MPYRTWCLLPAVLLALGAPAKAAFVIAKSPTRNVTCDNGTKTCSATADDAVLSVRDLTRLLSAFDLTLKAESGQNIEFRTPFAWSKPRMLTLSAHAVILHAPIDVAGEGGLTVTGSLAIRNGSHIDFQNLSSTLSIGGENYILVNSVATLAKYSGGWVALASDYDAGNDGTYASAPIATWQSGVLEGLGHTIANLTVRDYAASHSVGLIASTYYSVEIDDLGLLNADISGGDSADVGGLVGEFGDGAIRNTSVTGSVQGGYSASVGGIAGASETSGAATVIADSWSSATVMGNHDSRVGGLVGEISNNYPTKIENCYASGDVSEPFDAQAGGNDIGGLVGAIIFGDVIDSYATGDVLGGAGSRAGGLVGSSGTIKRSFATGTVMAGDDSDVGGLVGSGGGKIDQAYATGSATAGNTSSAGGLIGDYQLGAVANAYAAGAATVGASGYVGSFAGQTASRTGRAYGTGAVAGGAGSLIGGFVGRDWSGGQLSRADWDTDTTGIAKRGRGAGSPRHDHGIKGLSSTALQAGLPKGFSPSIWGLDAQINNGFPYLLALPPPQGARRATGSAPKEHR